MYRVDRDKNVVIIFTFEILPETIKQATTRNGIMKANVGEKNGFEQA